MVHRGRGTVTNEYTTTLWSTEAVGQPQMSTLRHYGPQWPWDSDKPVHYDTMVHSGRGTATNEYTMTLWSTEAATRQTHTQGGGVAKTLGPSGSDWRSGRADSVKPSAMSVNQTMQERGQCCWTVVRHPCVCPFLHV